MPVTIRKKKVDVAQLLRERQQLASEVNDIIKSVAEKNRRLAQIDAQLTSGIKQISKALQSLAGLDVSVVGVGATQVSLWDDQKISPSNLSRVTAKKKGKGSMLSEPVREVLRETGRVMTTRELYEELERRQVPIGGQRPMANLGAHLTNVEGVERQGNGWILKNHTVQ